MVEMSPLMKDMGDESGTKSLNHADYDTLAKTLQMPAGNQPKAVPPSSHQGGQMCGESLLALQSPCRASRLRVSC